jgi:hypothetical protein
MRVITLSKSKLVKCGNMKTFSSWWFSWYAAGRAENATTKNSGFSNSDSGGNKEAATTTVAVMTVTATATATATVTKTAKVTANNQTTIN